MGQAAWKRPGEGRELWPETKVRTQTMKRERAPREQPRAIEKTGQRGLVAERSDQPAGLGAIRGEWAPRLTCKTTRTPKRLRL
jgi:hypothetical protein